MADYENERALIRDVQGQLDGWIYEARTEAYTELFEGPDAVLSENELRLLDRVDSSLSREQGQGLWGADEYGIVQMGMLDEESTPHVVCTNHPQILEDAYPGEETLEEGTKARLDDALWEYCQRVVEMTQQRLEEFVWASDVATWE